MKLPNLSRYIGPWAIDHTAASELCAMVERCNDIGRHIQAFDEDLSAREPAALEVSEGGVAVVSLHGVLAKAEFSFGGTSLVEARRLVRAAAAREDVRSILLHVDSPGGTVAGTTDLGDDIAAIAQQMPVVAYIEDMAFSGATWLASQASQVLINRGGRTGSIGAYMVVRDVSAAMENEGIKVHLVASAPLKGATEEGVPVTEEALAEIQRAIDNSAERFIAAVASGRRMSLDQVRDLATGGTFSAEEAVANGLVDSIATLDDAVALVRDLASSTLGEPLMSQLPNQLPSTTGPVEPAAPAAPQPAAAPAAAAPAPQAIDPQTFINTRLTELSALIPGADRTFLLEQIAAGSSNESALQAFIARQNEQLQSAQAAAVAHPIAPPAVAQPAAAAPVPPGPAQQGHYTPYADRLAAQAAQAPVTSDTELRRDFMALVQEKKAQHGLMNREAFAMAARENPEGHQAFLRGCPPPRETPNEWSQNNS